MKNKIRKIEKSELELALNIYNSNKEFLIHHLGKECVDEEFLINEIDEMLAHGFTSNIVFIEDEPVGIIDYLLFLFCFELHIIKHFICTAFHV